MPQVNVYDSKTHIRGTTQLGSRKRPQLNSKAVKRRGVYIYPIHSRPETTCPSASLALRCAWPRKCQMPRRTFAKLAQNVAQNMKTIKFQWRKNA